MSDDLEAETNGLSGRSGVRIRSLWLIALGIGIAATVAIVIAIIAIDGGSDGSSNGQSSNGNGDGNGGPGTATDTPVPTPTPLAAEPTDSPIEEDDFRDPPSGFTPATPGDVALECTPELDLAAVFFWSTSEPAGEEQRLELDFSAQRFVTPPFFSSQSLEPGLTSLGWRIPAGFIFSWRVNTRINGGWVAGIANNVPTAACPPPDFAQ